VVVEVMDDTIFYLDSFKKKMVSGRV